LSFARGAVPQPIPRADSANDWADPPARSPARTDTVYFGGYDPGSGYAIQGETWTWDHDPTGPPYDTEGWSSRDITAQIGTFFRQITAASWAGHDNEPPAPLISGIGSLWCGAFEELADSRWRRRAGNCARLTAGATYSDGGDHPSLRYSRIARST
jgi:hypothetical protein